LLELGILSKNLCRPSQWEIGLSLAKTVFDVHSKPERIATMACH
jgi:hypothetical protein